MNRIKEVGLNSYLLLKRTTLVLLLIMFTALGTQAQERLQGLLYPDFQEGIVSFKDGRRVSALLNYSVDVEEMIYKEGDQILAIANPGDVIVVNIKEDTFVHGPKNIFYQVVPAGKGVIYVQWKSSIISQGKAAGYGGYSSTAAITNYSTIEQAGSVKKLKADEKLLIKPNNLYWIKNVKGRYVNVTTNKMMQKNFPSKNINAFCDQHNLDHTKHADMLKLMAYCFE